MQHTLVAVFDNRNDAQQALEDLVSSGFSRQEARLSEGDPSGQSSMSSSIGGTYSSPTSTSASSSSSASGASDSSAHDGSIGSSIRNFFSDIFGTDRSEHAQMYSDAVMRGHYVLTVTASGEPEVERAAGIVERYGPVDIDEQASQLGSSGMSDAARMGSTTGMQQSQSMSQQYAQGADAPLQGASQNAQFQTGQQRVGETQAIPVIQEELKVGKREVQRGGVRIFQRVVETPVNQTVGLREEHVNVERHAVNRPVDPAELSAFKETMIELRETSEEAVVEKTARVVEEVVVGKEVTQRNEQISDTVRRTEVDVQQLTPSDDAYFRGHWSSNFASQGGTYDDYAPAYSYGSSMRGNAAYSNRQWDDIEPNLRSDYESRYPNSTWEKMKSAVKHGWERVKS